MGNCQVTDTTMSVIQHPGGRVEKICWLMSASEVMKNNPGYYVALVTFYIPEEEQERGGGGTTVRLTRVRILKPKEMLLLGQVYRLIPSQEVMKALRARKNKKIKKNQEELIKRQQRQQRRVDDQGVGVMTDGRREDSKNTDQVTKQEGNRHKTSGTQSAGRPRHWRPSLQSIEEIGS